MGSIAVSIASRALSSVDCARSTMFQRHVALLVASNAACLISGFNFQIWRHWQKETPRYTEPFSYSKKMFLRQSIESHNDSCAKPAWESVTMFTWVAEPDQQSRGENSVRETGGAPSRRPVNALLILGESQDPLIYRDNATRELSSKLKLKRRVADHVSICPVIYILLKLRILQSQAVNHRPNDPAAEFFSLSILFFAVFDSITFFIQWKRERL